MARAHPACHFGTFSLHRPRVLRRGPAIEKLKILLQRLTRHPHPARWWRASLLSVAMLLGACSGGGSDTPSIPTAPTAAPPSVALDVAPDTVHETAAADLNWSSTNAFECVASGGWSGIKSLTGSESTGALAATTTYALTCTGPGGTAGHTVTANVTPANSGASGTSVSLSVSPASVNSGAAATLTWSSSNASGCTASGNWSGVRPVSGTASTGPLTVSASFALTCSGSGGAATQSVNVTVNSPGALPPPSISLSATPSTIANGGTTTLSWTATNATACTATGGWSGDQGAQRLRGSRWPDCEHYVCADLFRSRRDRLTGGYRQRYAGESAADSRIERGADALVQGASASLSWSSTNATACTASGDWTGAKAAQGTQSTGTLTAARTYSYGLSCTGPGGVASRSATVVVSATPPAPSISLSANPAQSHVAARQLVLVRGQRVNVHRFRWMERCQGDSGSPDDVRAFAIDDVHTCLYRLGRDDDPQRQRDRNACDAGAHGDAYGSAVRHCSGRRVHDELDHGQRDVMRRKR